VSPKYEKEGLGLWSGVRCLWAWATSWVKGVLYGKYGGKYGGVMQGEMYGVKCVWCVFAPQ
jgi:hypothetical protein